VHNTSVDALRIGMAFALAVPLTALAGQDPLTTLPDAYSKQFENEWVRVVRVYYAPHVTLPAHAHNALPAAYVYLTDAGPVVFRHVTSALFTATRRPTKAGSFRVFRGLENEFHRVENRSDLPSLFVRVEFKTDPKDDTTLRGRFSRDAVPASENVQTLQFENAQVRITRVICAPSRSMSLATRPSEPSLLIALQEAQMRESGADTTLRLGQERWLGDTGSLVFENPGPGPVEFLRFDFKTAPIAPPASPVKR
jgi:hypothetical protein